MRVCSIQELPEHIKPTKDCEGRKTVALKECQFCGNEYAVPKHKFNRSLYCQKDCQNKGTGVKNTGRAGPRGEDNHNWKGGISKDFMHYKRIQEERYPERCAARRAVGNAIRRGHLVRQPCEHCGITPTVGHHPDYSKPLDVIWLCRSCHRKVHGGRY